MIGCSQIAGADRVQEKRTHERAGPRGVVENRDEVMASVSFVFGGGDLI